MLENKKMRITLQSIWFFIGFICVLWINKSILAQENTQQSSSAGMQQEAREEAARKDKQIKQVISFGIDSDLVTAIQNLSRETPRLASDDGENITWIKETPYNTKIYERIKKGYSSSELQTKALRFFMQQKWLNAEEYVKNLIERSVDEGQIDNNLLLAALAYVRNLKLKSSEAGVLGLLASENPQIVERSLITLGKIGSNISAAEILRLLKDEENSFSEFSDEGEREVLRVAGISALGDLAYTDATKYLLKILEDSKNDDREYNNAEWGAAAKALGKMNQAEAVVFILERFRNGNTQERYQAIMALSSFPLQADFENIILQGLQEAYWKTREEAAKTAGKQKLQSAIPSLAYKVAKDSVVGVRRAAIQALRKMGAAGNSALSQLMQDPDVGENQRLDVLRVLTKARDESAVRIFRQLLNGQTNDFGLSRMGIFRVASNDPWADLDFVYKEMLSDRDHKTQQRALYSISRERIKSLQNVVAALAENSPNSIVRRAAKAALANLNS